MFWKWHLYNSGCIRCKYCWTINQLFLYYKLYHFYCLKIYPFFKWKYGGWLVLGTGSLQKDQNQELLVGTFAVQKTCHCNQVLPTEHAANDDHVKVFCGCRIVCCDPGLPGQCFYWGPSSSARSRLTTAICRSCRTTLLIKLCCTS